MTTRGVARAASAAHVLVSRFNVGLDAETSDGDAWLRQRVALFEQYTRSTVLRQRRLPDRWVVLCDDGRGSPPWFLDYLRRLESRWFRPRFLSDLHPAGIARTVSEEAPASAEWLITTRLDNDDAVSRDFVARIHAAARPRREFINFPVGLQYASQRIYWRLDPSGPFVSLVEPRHQPIETVFVTEHPDLSSVGDVRQIWGPPTWLQVIHGRNLGNVIAGVELPARRALDRFDLDLETRPATPARAAGSAWRLARKVAGKRSRWRRLGQLVAPAPRRR